MRGGGDSGYFASSFSQEQMGFHRSHRFLCENLGYNDAALTFKEDGGNHRKNPRCKAVDAVIAVFLNY